MSDILDSVVGELTHHLEQAEAIRASVEASVQTASDKCSAALKKVEAASQTINREIDSVEGLIANLDVALRPDAKAGTAGPSMNSAAQIDQVLTDLAGYQTEVLSNEMRSRTSEFTTDAVAERLQSAIQQYSDQMTDVIDWIDERLAVLVEASDAILEKSTEFAKQIGKAQHALTEKTAEVSEGLQELMSTLGEFATGRREELVEKLTGNLETAISDELNALTGGALESIASFNDKAEALTGDIVEQLSVVNDTFGKVLDIAEPVRPVIDLAASIS